LSIFQINKELPSAASQFIKLINPKITDEKHSLQLFQALGLAPTKLVSEIRKFRHNLEHNYQKPSETHTYKTSTGRANNKYNLRTYRLKQLVIYSVSVILCRVEIESKPYNGLACPVKNFR